MEGIVIKSIDYKEKSKLVYLYTPFGIKSVKALDASKKQLGFITTLNLVEFEMTGGSFPTVTEYTLKKSYYQVYEDLKKVGALAPILDIIFHLEEDANHQRIYPFFLKTIEKVVTSKDSYLILSVFLIKMLSVFGIKPEFKKCVRCSSLPLVDFSMQEGGALCEKCSIYHEKNFMILKDFYTLYYLKDYENIALMQPIELVLEEIYQYYTIHANFKLKEYHL